MSDLAGTAMFAPQARLVDLSTGKVIGASSSTSAVGERTFSVAPDLLSATVTLPNTGVGHLEVTLNNQRFVGELPAFPPWKYNNFALPKATAQTARTDGLAAVTFGQRLRLDMRYGDGDWTKMIIVQVTDLKFTFPASGFPQVTVVGEDLLSLMNIKPERDTPYSEKQEEEIVETVVATVYTDAQSKPMLATDSDAQQNEGRTQPLRRVTHSKSQSYFQFLTSLADRMDYEIFLQFINETVADTGNAAQASTSSISASEELALCFLPARSKDEPPSAAQAAWDSGEGGGEFHYVLKWGATLIEFTPTFKVFDIPTKISATGTQPGRRARETQTLEDADMHAFFDAELREAPSYPGVKPQSAVDARKRFFGDAGVTLDNAESSAGTNLDTPRLKLQALAKFAKRVREFMTVEATVIGLPKLRAGNHVEIVGLRPPFDGYYYVCKTIHTLDGSGYRTKLSLRRPGMLPPDLYLDRPHAQETSP
jgi:phage protein D